MNATGFTAGGHGSNSANVRSFNERVILTALRRLGEASKADLARHARLTSNTAGQIVKDLEARRLVTIGGKRADGSRGQPATLLSLNPDGAYAIGIKIGRRSLDALLVDLSGRVIERRRDERELPLPSEAVAFVEQSVASLRAACPPGAALARLAGLGLATPYDLGSWHRELGIGRAAFAAWNAFDIKAAVTAATGLATFVENDGTAATVAELFRGRGRTVDDFLYLFVGAAIGGGVVLGGQYRRGVTGNAGDVGLMPTSASKLASAPRPSGSHEILLTRASIAALLRHLRFSGLIVDSRAELECAIQARPPALVEWLHDCVDALVAPVLSAARILDVPRVVVDGDLPRPLLAELVGLLETALAAASPEQREPPLLLTGQVGRDAAAYGAAILPLHMSFSPHHEVLVGA